MQVIDLSKFGSAENMHAGFLAILDHYSSKGTFPKFNEDSSAIVAEAKKHLDLLGEFEWNEDLVKNHVKHCANEFAPISSLVGGIASQEVVK